jgi:hypothetical protein
MIVRRDPIEIQEKNLRGLNTKKLENAFGGS